jgi:hypothetical protein
MMRGEGQTEEVNTGSSKGIMRGGGQEDVDLKILHIRASRNFTRKGVRYEEWRVYSIGGEGRQRKMIFCIFLFGLLLLTICSCIFSYLCKWWSLVSCPSMAYKFGKWFIYPYFSI